MGGHQLKVFIRLKFEIMCTYVIFAKAMPMKKSQVLCVVLALNGTPYMCKTKACTEDKTLVLFYLNLIKIS
jgi:hypothetical protein